MRSLYTRVVRVLKKAWAWLDHFKFAEDPRDIILRTYGVTTREFEELTAKGPEALLSGLRRAQAIRSSRSRGGK